MLSLIYYDHHAGKINQQRFGSIIFLLRIRIRHTNQKRIRIQILVNQLQIAWNGWLTQKEKNVRILPLGHNQISAVICRGGVPNSGEISPKIGFLGKFYLTGDVGEILGKFDAKEENDENDLDYVEYIPPVIV